MIRRYRSLAVPISVVAVIVLALLPRFLGTYEISLVTLVLIWGIFAASLDILLGYGGLPSLGHSAYFGVGAYAFALLSLRLFNSFWLELLVAVAATVVIAAALGLLMLRARDVYFLMITLAVTQVLWGVAFGWRAVTGGDDGLRGIPRHAMGLPWAMDTSHSAYYVVLAFFVLSVGAMYVFVNSPFGKGLVGTRESESRMSSMGYNVWLYRYISFIVAGLFAGLAGSLYAFFNNFVSPTQLGVVPSAEALLMVSLGGAGTLFGPLFGAGVIVLVRNIVSGYTDRWTLILGLIYILVVMVAPNGVLALIRERFRRRVSDDEPA